MIGLDKNRLEIGLLKTKSDGVRKRFMKNLNSLNIFERCDYNCLLKTIDSKTNVPNIKIGD